MAEPNMLDALDMAENETPAAPEPPATTETPPATPEPEAAKPEGEAPKPEPPSPDPAVLRVEQENQRLREQISKLEAQPKLSTEDAALLKELREQRAVPPKEEPVPDYLEDPQGYVDRKVGTLTQSLQKLEQATTAATTKATETAEQVQQREQLNQLMVTVNVQETEFTKEHPDYQQALLHMRTQRAEQLQELFPDATQAQILAQLRVEEVQAAARAVQAGKNPAQVAYKLAGTFGYRKAAAPPPAAPAREEPDRDAARSLATATGADAQPEQTGPEGSTVPEFHAALAERFGRRR